MLSEKITPKFIPPQLWRPNSADLNPAEACRNIARKGVQNMHHWSGPIDDATDEWRTRSSTTAKSTVRPLCLVGVLYDVYREKNSADG